MSKAVKREYTPEEIRAAGERVTNALRAERGLPPIVVPMPEPDGYVARAPAVQDLSKSKVLW